MMYQIDMECLADAPRHEVLNKVMCCLPVDSTWKQLQPAHDSPTVTINRKDFAIEGVHQDASRHLWTHTRERAQKPLRFLIGHLKQRLERNGVEPLLNGPDLIPKTIQLYFGHASTAQRLQGRVV